MTQEKKSNEVSAVTANRDTVQQFWDERYKSNITGWDLGEISPPLKEYIDQLDNKKLRILIPGCGNSYEAEYILKKGFSNITVIDISPTLVKRLQKKFKGNKDITIVLSDFFEHRGKYDLILEQTFFCALDPGLRTRYRDKMFSLLAPEGKLVGVLFDKEFEDAGPPFGGTKNSYEALFKDHFELHTLKRCRNSFFKRKDTELFIILKKKSIK